MAQSVVPPSSRDAVPSAVLCRVLAPWRSACACTVAQSGVIVHHAVALLRYTCTIDGARFGATIGVTIPPPTVPALVPGARRNNLAGGLTNIVCVLPSLVPENTCAPPCCLQFPKNTPPKRLGLPRTPLDFEPESRIVWRNGSSVAFKPTLLSEGTFPKGSMWAMNPL